MASTPGPDDLRQLTMGMGQPMNEVSLRDVHESDLPVFFEHQVDPDATRMASFPARSRDEFMVHWAKSMSDKTTILKTIVVNGEVAGNIVGWEQSSEPKVGYWLGKEYWGRGIASEALSQFLRHMEVRPLYARVAKQNIASIRVLQKCGFTKYGEDTFTAMDGGVGEEFILVLGARCQDKPN
jgi:RimJ/RimL family protein N-acetyltransferase